VFVSDDHSTVVSSVKTDQSGKYSLEVPAGSIYDIYVRVGEKHPNQRTQELKENGIYTLNFKIQESSNVSTQNVEKYGFWLVVAVSALIVFLILIDQIFLRKKRVMGDLEQERLIIEKRLEEHSQEGDESLDDLTKLNNKKTKIEYMINSTRTKYHKNQIDEETFREIVRDYQKQLIEVEAKIAGFKE
ncbi:MAG: hypothetical protein ABH950_08355, partial [Candidatus Altiarchaeota archaeon]